MKTRHIVTATAVTAAAGMLAAYLTTSQAQIQESETARPMMQQPMKGHMSDAQMSKDHMSKDHMTSGMDGQMDMQAMHAQMMKDMCASLSSPGDKGEMGMEGMEGQGGAMMNREAMHHHRMMQRMESGEGHMDMQMDEHAKQPGGGQHQHDNN